MTESDLKKLININTRCANDSHFVHVVNATAWLLKSYATLTCSYSPAESCRGLIVLSTISV